MSYTVPQLITDIIQRVGRFDNAAGITMIGAANVVQDMLGKKLLGRRSELLADNNMLMTIPAYGCSVALPDGFMSMAEKPVGYEVNDNYMTGTLEAYDANTKIATFYVDAVSGSATLSDWSLGTYPNDETDAVWIASSKTLLNIGSTGGLIYPVVDRDVTAYVGSDIILIANIAPSSTTTLIKTLEPYTLNDAGNDQDDYWWGWYGLFGWKSYPPSKGSREYKIVNTTLYIRPYTLLPLTVSGKYFGLPAKLTGSSVIPWNGLFDEVFREGVVRILQKGITNPDVEPDFAMFLTRAFDSVLDARAHILPKTRTTDSNFM